MGKTWKFRTNVNTDEIIPGRYNITTDEKDLAKHVFCEIRPDFPANVKPGDFVVAGENFGCGSSREHAPVAIKAAGVKCVIAKSFARIFFRNSLNIGLPIMECSQADQISEGDDLEADLVKGIVFDKSTGKTFKARPMPGFLLKIIESGGLISYLKSHDLEDLQ